ncbi:MAG: M48 family metallopeptidase [Clostridiales bacterium]|nr:M48 family metallopeptidase [Clostridiales bacterium]
MEYKLVRSNRKTLTIKINEKGQVVVCSPNKCSLKYIDDFVKSKQDWIIKNRQKVISNNQQNVDFLNLEYLMIFGEKLKIVDFGNHYQIGEYYVKHTKASKKSKIIKQFCNSLANEYIIPRVKQLANMLGLEYKNAEIISARKKWGSCSSLKQLKFNFRLIMLPKVLIDYVICHELCHLKQMNHSKEFWNLLEKLGFKKSLVKNEFKKYGFVLQML